jgi:phosphonopyruvate decarboxylase
MIRAELFVESLRQAGFGLVSGTPCSYLTPLINTVIDSAETEYIGAANEGDAVAIACGAELGGKPGVVMFQNSGLGNAVNPLTSLSAIFRIPLLIITTWRGQPGGAADEPQHELMGRITPDLLDLMQIPWESFPESEEAIQPALARAVAHMLATGTPYGLIMKGGVVSPHALQTRPDALRRTGTAPPEPGRSASSLEQDEALAAIQSAVGETDALLTTTGYTGRALYALDDRPNQLYMVGSMGCVSGLGLGLAKAQAQRRVVVIDGDGAVLMRMGLLATLGYEAPSNLVHIVLDNGVHDSTGGQGTVSASADLAAAAWACGYPRVIRASSSEALQAALRNAGRELTFIHVPTRPRGSRKLPRPTMTPAEVAERFRQWLKSTASFSGGYRTARLCEPPLNEALSVSAP